MDMNYSNNQQSEYNELAFKMIRMNELQRKIQIYWENPKGLWINPYVMGGNSEYGFVLIFSNLECLYDEIRAKCTKEEREKVDEIVDEIDKEIQKGPEAIFKKKQIYDKYEYVDNTKKWIELKQKLRNLQRLISDLKGRHGYDPNKDDVEGL